MFSKEQKHPSSSFTLNYKLILCETEKKIQKSIWPEDFAFLCVRKGGKNTVKNQGKIIFLTYDKQKECLYI